VTTEAVDTSRHRWGWPIHTTSRISFGEVRHVFRTHCTNYETYTIHSTRTSGAKYVHFDLFLTFDQTKHFSTTSTFLYQHSQVCKNCWPFDLARFIT